MAVDSLTTFCTLDDCDKPRRARGLCITHYNAAHRKPNPTAEFTCPVCGDTFTAERARAKRYRNLYCSATCMGRGFANGPTCDLPDDHWARWYVATSTWEPPAPERARFFANTCDDCGASFIEHAYGVPSSYCSATCAARIARRRRRAREHGAPGEYRYSEIMRQYRRQGYACAYCKLPCDGLPDPEHVLPLSRGGRNDMSNLVAACRSCNADKNDLTLDEWAADRQRRGLEPVDTALQGDAYLHLARLQPTSPAWRDRAA